VLIRNQDHPYTTENNVDPDMWGASILRLYEIHVDQIHTSPAYDKKRVASGCGQKHNQQWRVSFPNNFHEEHSILDAAQESADSTKTEATHDAITAWDRSVFSKFAPDRFAPDR